MLLLLGRFLKSDTASVQCTRHVGIWIRIRILMCHVQLMHWTQSQHFKVNCIALYKFLKFGDFPFFLKPNFIHNMIRVS